ncbi:zincin [Melanomma pulvis-pyrius CBS 109.77]|uniref:Zincin n=1 Tax=Melanomma pulvis-pyrius CBS 109.77 TaxID=1314802 RepID=A0A6A6XEJ3_9PLEO|nr:zincin [Melanomma pulvis-pyrius CBS 109.77]
MRYLISILTLLAGSWAATFTSCSAPQIATLETALERATNKSYAAIKHLEANPNGSALQTTWYGTFSTTRYNKILTAFKKFAPDLATTFSYDCSCVSDVVIATPENTYGRVRICSVYFNTAVVPATGHRSQWDTIVHEATHFRAVLGTTDSGYGVEACKRFALEDPEKAVNNADNHARFAVEVEPFGP